MTSTTLRLLAAWSALYLRQSSTASLTAEMVKMTSSGTQVVTGLTGRDVVPELQQGDEQEVAVHGLTALLQQVQGQEAQQRVLGVGDAVQRIALIHVPLRVVAADHARAGGGSGRTLRAGREQRQRGKRSTRGCPQQALAALRRDRRTAAEGRRGRRRRRRRCWASPPQAQQPP